MTRHRTAALMIFAIAFWLAGSAFAGDGIASVTANDGRKIFVNTSDLPHANSFSSSTTADTGTSGPIHYVYWSNTEHRFKPIPAKSVLGQRARSAAAEVMAEAGTPQASAEKTTTDTDSDSTYFSSEKVSQAIDLAAARHNVDPELVRAVIKVESNFNPRAVSRKGAMGLMQLMPDTARSLNVAHPFDPTENVDAGVRHLRKLLDQNGGDVGLSLAAYNAGQKAVDQHNGIPPYRETQLYVRQITTLYKGGNIGTPWRTPIKVSRDAEGHLLFSNTE